MSRPTVKHFGTTERRNTPSYGDAIAKQGASVRLAVNAPLNVRAAPSSAEKLAGVLGVVNDIAQPALQQQVFEGAKSEAQLGLANAMAGVESEEKIASRPAYKIGFQRGAALRDFAEAKQDWEALVQEHGLNELTEDEYKDKLEGYIRERFGYLAENDVARDAILEQSAKWQLDQIESHGKLIIEREQAEYLDNTGVALADAYAEGKLADVVPQVYSDHYGMLGGTASNETIVKQLGELAVATGDPSVLDMIPSRASSVPRLGRLSEQYRREAESVRDNRLVEEKKATERLNKDAKEAAERGVMLSMMDGTGKGHTILRDAVAAGVIPADEGRVWFNMLEASKRDKANSDGGFGDVNYDNVADIEARVLSRQAGRKEIAEARASGKFGKGEIADRETARLMQLQVEVERENRSLAYQTFDDQIDADFPVTDEAGRRVPEMVKKNVEVKSRYREAIKAGKPPHEAHAEAMKGTPKSTPAAPAANQQVAQDVLKGEKRDVRSWSPDIINAIPGLSGEQRAQLKREVLRQQRGG